MMMLKLLFVGVAWRFRRFVGDARLDNFIIKVAHRCRPWLKHTQVVGIIGSAGKTTTKELLQGMLATKMRGTANPSSLNAPPEVAKTILRAILRRDYCVVELSEDRPGVMDATLPLLRPSIGIVTVVRDDHLAAFDSRDGLALEMEKLVRALPASGTAVLNADDERVLAMAEVCKAKVITYGVSANAELRAEEVSSDWPKRLQMTLVHGTTRVRLETQLCGTHWLPSVLGAIGGGLATGLTLNECAAGIAKVEPFEGRMQPVNTADGVTFIRDDFKAPLWTVDSCFEFMKAASATRKIVVIGTLSDCGSQKSEKYLAVALKGQPIFELMIFVGPWASCALKLPKLAGKELRVFSHVLDAAEYLNSVLTAGDLVLLKGSTKQDHLLRILLSHEKGVACWREGCNRVMFCTDCSLRNIPSTPYGKHPASAKVDLSQTEQQFKYPVLEPSEQVIVGLGNPELGYVGTPHNVGYEVVNSLASKLQFNWLETKDAWLARGNWEGNPVCLVKIKAPMNLIGFGLASLSQSMQFSAENCIIVFDDLALPLGAVRTKLSGSAGGHRGVASILEAFQTDKFRRIKIGVKPQNDKINRLDYVISVFDSTCQVVIDEATTLAQARVLELVVLNAKAP